MCDVEEYSLALESKRNKAGDTSIKAGRPSSGFTLFKSFALVNVNFIY
jgi:hypothetical protein